MGKGAASGEQPAARMRVEVWFGHVDHLGHGNARNIAKPAIATPN